MLKRPVEGNGKAENLVLTWDILPKREAEAVLRLCGVKLAAPVAFSVCWSSSNNVDAFESQYARTSLLSGTCSNVDVTNISYLHWILESTFADFKDWTNGVLIW